MGTNRTRGADLYILKHGMTRECEVCHNTEWNGKKIPLQIHHKDGNHYNNSEDNIQILCPNCHAQTDTYCSKNRKKLKITYTCDSCGKTLHGKSKTGLCAECYQLSEKNKSKCPDKETLQVDLETLKSYSAICRKYGVSDKTVKKWCDNYGLTVR